MGSKPKARRERKQIHRAITTALTFASAATVGAGPECLTRAARVGNATLRYMLELNGGTELANLGPCIDYLRTTLDELRILDPELAGVTLEDHHREPARESQQQVNRSHPPFLRVVE